MKEKIEVSVYQHPTFEEGSLLFEEDVLAVLLAKCQRLFKKAYPRSKYHAEEVEQQFTQLLKTVALEKSLQIKLLDGELPWEGLLKKLKRYYPQMVWISGKQITGVAYEYSFDFIPLVENANGFPFGTALAQSLVQQGVPSDEDPVTSWEQEVFYIVEDHLRTIKDELKQSQVPDNDIENLSDESYYAVEEEVEMIAQPAPSIENEYVVVPPTPAVENEYIEMPPTASSVENEYVEMPSSPVVEPVKVVDAEEKKKPLVNKIAMGSKSEAQRLKNENKQLKREQKRLRASNQQLVSEINSLNQQVVTTNNQLELSNSPVDLNKQALYYEEALRRERDAKERMRVTNDKLEHLVNRLERQVMESSLEIIEGEVPYVERVANWHKKKNIDLMEYDKLYQKAKYLEHTWQVNQRLIVISERITIDEKEMKYERERVNRLKQSTKDIELFVMMDECKMINERVKVKKSFLWVKPRVQIMTGDYENLVEKAAYFDIIQSENQMLEKIIEEHADSDKK